MQRHALTVMSRPKLALLMVLNRSKSCRRQCTKSAGWVGANRFGMQQITHTGSVQEEGGRASRAHPLSEADKHGGRLIFSPHNKCAALWDFQPL